MKHKSKFLAILLAAAILLAVLSLTLVACGKDEEHTQNHEHSYTLVEAKAPTCTEDGNIQYYTCNCGKYFDNNKQEIEGAQTVIPATGHDKVTTSWESDGTSHWHKCNNCDAKLDFSIHFFSDGVWVEDFFSDGVWVEDSAATCTAKAHWHRECPICKYHIAEVDDGEILPHELGEWIEDSEATCTKQAHHHKECANCDYTLEEDYGYIPHKWKEQLTNDKKKECSVCGYKEPVYEEKNGKIYFGEYPQTKVEDNGITATLAQMSGDRPVKGNSGKWTNYGYYFAGDDEWMWYIDLDYNAARYRGVYFTRYRPWSASHASSNNTYQNYNGYFINRLYWFKWEPIEWRVLERTDSDVFLMSNVILDSQYYYRDRDNYRTIDGKTIYPNNYKESDIRAWLNGTFYNWAFDKADQSIIETTLVDNSASTTRRDPNSCVCENTNDKVFLLSYQDVYNSKYGFDSIDNQRDTAKMLKTTSYAQSQGAETGPKSTVYRDSGWWFLRSPEGSYDCVVRVSYDGHAIFNESVDAIIGIVPAIKITL